MLQLNCPKGDKIKSEKKAVRSPWREFEFWFMMVQYRIIPVLSVDDALNNWDRIKEGLMEECLINCKAYEKALAESRKWLKLNK